MNLNSQIDLSEKKRLQKYNSLTDNDKLIIIEIKKLCSEEPRRTMGLGGGTDEQKKQRNNKRQEIYEKIKELKKQLSFKMNDYEHLPELPKLKPVAKIGYINRKVDNTGISGTGRVAEFIEYDNRVIVQWLCTGVKSMVIYNNIDELKQINCHGGNSEIIYY